jgi:hypothetical protein
VLISSHTWRKQLHSAMTCLCHEEINSFLQFNKDILDNLGHSVWTGCNPRLSIFVLMVSVLNA